VERCPIQSQRDGKVRYAQDVLESLSPLSLFSCSCRLSSFRSLQPLPPRVLIQVRTDREDAMKLVLSIVLLIPFFQADVPVFEIDLWPGEGRPVFEFATTILGLRALPSASSKISDTVQLTLGSRCRSTIHVSERFRSERSVFCHLRELRGSTWELLAGYHVMSITRGSFHRRCLNSNPARLSSTCNIELKARASSVSRGMW